MGFPSVRFTLGPVPVWAVITLSFHIDNSSTSTWVFPLLVLPAWVVEDSQAKSLQSSRQLLLELLKPKFHTAPFQQSQSISIVPKSAAPRAVKTTVPKSAAPRAFITQSSKEKIDGDHSHMISVPITQVRLTIILLRWSVQSRRSLMNCSSESGNM